MKLCKDCKHYRCATNPLMNANGSPFYAVPMCDHPDAPHSPVNGAAHISCEEARGARPVMLGSTRLFCELGKRFEARPATAEEAYSPEFRRALLTGGQLPPGAVVPMEPVERRVSFWKRIFGG